MTSEIIVNVSKLETRVALLQNNLLAELYIERQRDKGIVGNIYKGIVTRVLPGMQAAFVDIGLEKAGFLYIADVDSANHAAEFERLLAEGEEMAELDEEIARHEIRRKGPGKRGKAGIEDILQKGHELLVQVSKEPMGSKGSRLTTYIAIPGRYLVYMPTVDHVGVSRRIEDEAERKRLKDLVRSLKSPGTGYIVRTESEGREKEDFRSDMEFLESLWRNVLTKAAAAPAPSLIHPELNLVLRAVRDLFTQDMSRMVLDNPSEHEGCLAFVDTYLPHLRDKIELFKGKEPIFDAFGIELEIERALRKKVWLKSGGYIVIEHTEAMTAIDVNTGRFVGKRNPEETILRTNLEAVQEIVYQLRLRNIGGIIILDFIDMEREESKEKLYAALENALKSDRSRTTIQKVSQLGLVEMTRKRTRESLSRVLCDPCPYCEGRGQIKSALSVSYEIFREIRRVINAAEGHQKIMATAHPDVADLLLDEESHFLEELERESGKKIIVKPDYELHREQFDVIPI